MIRFLPVSSGPSFSPSFLPSFLISQVYSVSSTYMVGGRALVFLGKCVASELNFMAIAPPIDNPVSPVSGDSVFFFYFFYFMIFSNVILGM